MPTVFAFSRTIRSRFGAITIVATDKGIAAVSFGACTPTMKSALARRLKFRFPQQKPSRAAAMHLSQCAAALARFFKRDFRAIARLKLVMSGTPFQTRVWRELRRIAPGSNCSYSEIAARVGRPRAARAVGQACNRNPLALVVPCHRVIGADQRLVGYAGGLDRKGKLLEFEGLGTACRRV